MKMKCTHCGKTVGTKNNFCEFCGKSTYKQHSMRKTFTLLIVFVGITAAVITAITILWRNYLLPWQLPLYKDRKAIIEYARENHPNSEIAGEHIKYLVSGYLIFNEFKPDCYIIYEENGFKYRVYARDGKVIIDDYSKMKLQSEVSAFINDEFLKPRGIENVDIRSAFDCKDTELPSEWSEYNDKFWVRMDVRGQGTTPQEVGWLWDFYEFWRDNQQFGAKWSLDFDIYHTTNPNSPYPNWDRVSSISIWYSKQYFDSKEEWYAEMTCID